jgi:hypothetical protein
MNAAYLSLIDRLTEKGEDIKKHRLTVFPDWTRVACRFIPDFHNAIEELQEIPKHLSVSRDRQQSSVDVVRKLQKYLDSYIDNNWTCAAFALDPAVQEEGFRALLVDEMKNERRFNEAIR